LIKYFKKEEINSFSLGNGIIIKRGLAPSHKINKNIFSIF